MPNPTAATDSDRSATIALRRWSYRLALLLGLLYVTYVLTMKFSGRVLGGPLGDLGEFALVLLATVAFAVGLFADEASRATPDSIDPQRQQETT
ncbi:MAG: hypothetical protein ABIN96_05665 [Rubrivivax sp.]